MNQNGNDSIALERVQLQNGSKWKAKLPDETIVDAQVVNGVLVNMSNNEVIGACEATPWTDSDG